MSKIFFDKIPVLKVTGEKNEEFREIVNSLQSSYTKEHAMRIDAMLFDLYNLTDEERNAIGFVEID